MAEGIVPLNLLPERSLKHQSVLKNCGNKDITSSVDWLTVLPLKE